MSIPSCESKHQLTDVNQVELDSISVWLENAPFDRRGDFEQCSDNAGLLQHATRFLHTLSLPVPYIFHSNNIRGN
jgi:hypothetical protein